MLSEVSQIMRHQHQMLSLTCGIWKKDSMNFFAEQILTHRLWKTHGFQMRQVGGGGCAGVVGWQSYKIGLWWSLYNYKCKKFIELYTYILSFYTYIKEFILECKVTETHLQPLLQLPGQPLLGAPLPEVENILVFCSLCSPRVNSHQDFHDRSSQVHVSLTQTTCHFNIWTTLSCRHLSLHMLQTQLTSTPPQLLLSWVLLSHLVFSVLVSRLMV